MDAKRSKINPKYNPVNLNIVEYDYSEWYKEKLVDKKESDNLPPLEQEVKKWKSLKIFNSKQLLTRTPILLAQAKAGISTYKLKNEIRQILHLLYQHNKITKKVYNKLIKSL